MRKIFVSWRRVPTQHQGISGLAAQSEIIAYFALAEREALLVSIRTKAALAAKKARGFKLEWPAEDMAKVVAASARIRRENARNNRNNKIIWGVVGQGGAPTAADARRMSALLNRMGVKTATKLEFTPGRVRSAYHNLKRIYR